MTSVTKEGLVEFWFFRRDVNDVRVVGDFGTAGDGGFALTGGPDGWWRATVALDAGEYRFRYVADGVWFTDYASNGIEVTKVGVNSLLVVPRKETPLGLNAGRENGRLTGTRVRCRRAPAWRATTPKARVPPGA